MLTALYVVALVVALFGIPGACGKVTAVRSWLGSAPGRVLALMSADDSRTCGRCGEVGPSSQICDCVYDVRQRALPPMIGTQSKALWASVAHARERAAGHGYRPVAGSGRITAPTGPSPIPRLEDPPPEPQARWT
jgi:hypothetical protein